MLILTRRIGEEIVIGEAVRVEILGMGQGKVRVGVTAPKHCKILRAELRRDADSDLDSELPALDTPAVN